MASGDKFAVGAQAAGFYAASSNIVKGAGDTITIPQGMVNIGGNGKGYVMAAVANLDPTNVANRDNSFSAFAVGQNYYIYACQQAGTAAAKILVSINSTYPNGYSASTSRKIGGFHYGRVRAVDGNNFPINGSSAVYGSGWKANVANGIVWNSVWCLQNRPKCDPTGMAKVGRLWVDIYLVAQDIAPSVSNYKLVAGSGKSAYNSTPLSGTEGLSGDNFNELAKRTGKRLLTLDEWRQVAEGSPQGEDGNNTNAWAATSNVARNPTGGVANAISAHNIVDCVGNLWEWLATYSNDYSSVAWQWANPESAGEVGKYYIPNAGGLIQYLAGGYWSNGVVAGSRAVNVNNYPWNVNTNIGSRFACDCIAFRVGVSTEHHR